MDYINHFSICTKAVAGFALVDVNLHVPLLGVIYCSSFLVGSLLQGCWEGCICKCALNGIFFQ